MARIVSLLGGLTLLFCLDIANAQFTCPLSLLIPFHDGRQITSMLFDSSNTAEVSSSSSSSRSSNSSSSSSSSSIVTQKDHQRDGLTLLATALLAMQDFNNRSSSLVPQLFNVTCDIFYPKIPIVLDSGRAAENITQHRDVWLTNTSCAVIGPDDNLAAEAVANTLLGTIVPAISYGATAPILTNASFYPNIALGTVQWEDTVRTLSEYLFANRRYNVAVMYEPGEQLDYYDYVQVWDDVLEEIGLNLLLSLISSRSKDAFYERLRVVKDMNMRTVVVALHRDDNLEQLAEAADDLGLLSEEYWWIFLDSFLSPQYIERANQLSSPSVQKLLARTRIFQLLDGLVPIGDIADSVIISSGNFENITFGRFQSEWSERGAGLVDEMNFLLGQSPGLEALQVDKDFFVSNPPSYGASFLYDAILAVGMTACSGQPILNASFIGASTGMYQFVDRSLNVETLVHGVFAVQVNDDDDDNNKALYQPILIDSNIDGYWTELPATKSVNNYLSIPATIIGMVLASIGIIFCAISCAFVFTYRKDRIVSVSQPEFMYMICFGAALNAATIYFISFDDASLDDKTLDIFCVLQVWLSRVGIVLVYCAIFSKLWRVEKVTQMRRGQRIEVKHVLGPFSAMMVTCISLLVAWTVADPPAWERVTYEGKFPKGEGSVGLCEENLGFALSIDVIIVLGVSVSLWMSCKTRHLPEDISDSRRVHQTLTAHLVLQIINVVLMTLSFLFRKTNLSYMARSLLLFMTTISSIAFLVLPKMYYVWRKQKTGELPPGLQRGRVRVSGVPLRPPVQPFSTSRFTVNQARTPGPSLPSSRISGISSNRTDTAMTSSLTSASVYNKSGRSLGSRATSIRDLQSSNASSGEKASSVDLNASITSGLDLDRSIVSNDMNSSTRSILKNSNLGLSPSKIAKPSVTQSVSFAGNPEPGSSSLAPSAVFAAPPIDENRSASFSGFDYEDDSREIHA